MAQNHLIQIFLLRRKLQREQKKTEQLEQELWDTRQVRCSLETSWMFFGRNQKSHNFTFTIVSWPDTLKLMIDEIKETQRESIWKSCNL